MESSKRRKIESDAKVTKAPTYNTSHFDLTSTLASDVSILNSEYEQIPVQTQTSDILEFHIPPSAMWLALAEINLILTLQAVTKDGSSLPAATKTAIGNCIISTFFQALDIKLDGINLCNGGDLYSYSSYYQQVLFNSTETIVRKGPLAGLFLNDKESALDAENSAYKELQKLAKASSFEVCAPIFHGFFDTPRFLAPGHSLTLKYRIAPNTFYLNSSKVLATGEVFQERLSVLKAVLDVRKVVAHSEVDLVYEAAINKNIMMSYPITDRNCTAFIVPKGMLTYTSEVLFNSLPQFCAMGLVKATAYYGAHNECPFSFLPHNLNGYRFTINGDDVLFNSPRFSVSDNDYIRHYNQLLQIENEKGLPACDLSKEQFCKQNYFILPLINTSNGKRDRYSVSRQGQVRIQLSFSTNTTENLACVVFTHFPRIVQFNKTNVFVKDDINLEHIS